MDFILVFTCISYMDFEHPMVYMYMHVCYVCIDLNHTWRLMLLG